MSLSQDTCPLESIDLGFDSKNAANECLKLPQYKELERPKCLGFQKVRLGDMLKSIK